MLTMCFGNVPIASHFWRAWALASEIVYPIPLMVKPLNVETVNSIMSMPSPSVDCFYTYNVNWFLHYCKGDLQLFLKKLSMPHVSC